jgi:hypothetical protein
MERIFAVSGDWALGSDGVQWILYHRDPKSRTGWKGISFVRSERDILARCMREKGCPEDDGERLLAGLPNTFDKWKGLTAGALIDAGGHRDEKPFAWCD